MVVLPEHDAVVAMFSCTEDMQTVLDLMWEHLVPALDFAAQEPSADDDALAARLSGLSMPTAADRLDGAPPELPAMTFKPFTDGWPAHRTVTRVEAGDGQIVVHEDDSSFTVPLSVGWTVVDRSLAASAARSTDGSVVVDLVFLASPHRLEIELDPAAGTFLATWPVVPLFGAGLDQRLGAIHVPAD
jgi:hypothetical protein